MKRIGILGGSFDPVHLGHLMMAEFASEAFGLDKVFFVVANQSPFKSVKNASPQQRLAMVKMAIKGNSRFEASNIELKRRGISYTIDTLGYYHKRFPKAELFFIIGQDNVPGLSKWKDIEAIKRLAQFIVIERDWFNVSSTLIRQRLLQKKSIRYLTPDGVIRYINKYLLYR